MAIGVRSGPSTARTVPGGTSTQFTFQDAAGAIGDGSPMTVDGFAGVMVQIQGITIATVTFEATIDGTNWVAIEGNNVSSGASATTATADGLYFVSVAGVHQFRCRISAYTSGSIAVVGQAENLSSSFIASAGLSASVNQGNQGAQNQPWWVQPTDGTHSQPTGDAAARPVHVTQDAQAAGGASKSTNRDLGAKVQVKGSAGTLYGLLIESTIAAAAYVQVFDALTAGVTLGTTTPDIEIPVVGVTNPVFVPVSIPQPGALLSTGITIASTTASKGSSTSASGVHVTLLYA
jgi:hypothetical protein